MTKKNVPDKSFGELETSLQSMVNKLESTDLSLEDAVTTYEEACHTLKLAQERLDAAEQKVRMLQPAAGDTDPDDSAADEQSTAH